MIVTLALAWLALYNSRVTGDPLKLPYMVYSEQYQKMPIWTWQAARTPARELTREMNAYAAWEVAVDLDAAAIVCCTRSGRTARAMARFRPPCPLLAYSPDPEFNPGGPTRGGSPPAGETRTARPTW